MTMQRILPQTIILTAWIGVGTLVVAADQLLMDPGFEETALDRLETGTTPQGWEIQRTGRAEILDRLIVSGVGDAQSREGNRAILLGLPKETVGFEFVTVGQRVRVERGKDYMASLWVRWKDGPDVKPADSTTTSGSPSAIVSFWARHADGKGAFSGRDEWLFDGNWHQLRFRFRATQPDLPVFLYVSLLPNQVQRQTSLLIDDFQLSAVPGEIGREPRKENLIKDPGFDHGEDGKTAPPWYFAGIGGQGIDGRIVQEDGERFFRMSMNDKTGNLESAQLWQHVGLKEGAAYEISCRMRWENRRDRKDQAIVNFGIYHEASNTWYGPVDQVLEPSDGWVSYRFLHVPPYGGPWKIYAQLNGWGNFGRGLAVSFDEFVCRACETP
jgi:hypothetical protein